MMGVFCCAVVCWFFVDDILFRSSSALGRCMPRVNDPPERNASISEESAK
jgi:hypothetical protein